MKLLKFALLKSCSLYYQFFSPPPFFTKNHELCAAKSTLLELPIFLSWFVFTCESLRIQFILIQLPTYLPFPPPTSNQNTYNWNKNSLSPAYSPNLLNSHCPIRFLFYYVFYKYCSLLCHHLLLSLFSTFMYLLDIQVNADNFCLQGTALTLLTDIFVLSK